MSRGQGQLETFGGPRGDPLASVSRRSLAWVIDVLVITVLIFVGVSVVDEVFGPTVRFHQEAAELTNVVSVDTGLLVANGLFATGLSAAYFVLPWALLGGSPGQLALRVRVGDDAGDPTLTVGQALVRWLLLFPPFATVSALTVDVPRLGWLIWGSAPVWYLVLLLTTVRSETRQGLHDRLAHTSVRRRRAATG